MLFKLELADKILMKQKTQTRRPAKPTDDYRRRVSPLARGTDDVDLVMRGAIKRVKWECGKTYAIQCGRGHPGLWYSPANEMRGILSWEGKPEHYADARPARIEIHEIRNEDVREISLADAQAEGFKNEAEFWAVWCAFYDPAYKVDTRADYASVYGDLRTRSNSLYDAWALSFVLVETSA